MQKVFDALGDISCNPMSGKPCFEKTYLGQLATNADDNATGLLQFIYVHLQCI